MIKKTKFIIVYLVLIAAGVFVNFHSDIDVPMSKGLKDFPFASGGWSMTSQSLFSESILGVLKPTDYLARSYRGPAGENVQLYIGYHGGGKGSGQIHSPKQCLPGGGWYRASERKTNIEAAGRRVNLVSAVYMKGDDRELFLYWFSVKGKTISDEYALKLDVILNSVLYRRRDSAFIRISVPFGGDEEAAYRDGVRFINDFYPYIEEFLPR